MSDKQEFKNQVVVITGGASGIGLAVAKAFAKAKAKVIILGRDPKKLQLATRQMSKLSCLTVKCDVADGKAVANAVNKIVATHARIDILVNCAGIYGPIGKFHETDLDSWKEALGTNLLGTVNVCHAVLPFMLKQKHGAIVNLSGGGAVQPFPNFSAYATSKAAVVRFTENLAEENQPYNIKINAVAPGAINTVFLDKVLKAGPKKAGMEFYNKSLEQKQSGGDSPEDAAELILFLCSGRSGKLTGKLVAAKWDPWRNWKPGEISNIGKNSSYTLRRIDNKYFKAF